MLYFLLFPVRSFWRFFDKAITETDVVIVWHEAKTLFQQPLHQNISHDIKQSMWIMGSTQTTLKETFISSFGEDNTEKTICLY